MKESDRSLDDASNRSLGLLSLVFAWHKIMNVDSGILSLEKSIGLEKGFFENLINEKDDWSFIIKLHALLEAACSHLLSFHFKEPELDMVLSRLELSNKSTGKLAFLKATELMSDRYRRYISTLSELRNSLVHDIRNSKFFLKEMFEGLSEKEKVRFAKLFSPYETFIIEMNKSTKGTMIDMNVDDNFNLNYITQRAASDPRLHIWQGAHAVLVSIVDNQGFSDYKQWRKANELFTEDT